MPVLAVVLRMRRREVAAVIVVVVFLLAVIGQRRAARLAPADAAAVGEGRQEQRIDAAELRERVEHLVGAFVEEGDRADLDADGFVRHLCHERRRPSEDAETGRCRRRAFEKFPSVHCVPRDADSTPLNAACQGGVQIDSCDNAGL